MMTILLKRREYLRAAHLPRQTCSLAMDCERVSYTNLLSLTALLLKGQSDCKIRTAKIRPPARGPVRDCIRPNFSERLT